MKQLLDIKGIITVLNTPFTKTDEIDIASLKKNVSDAINSGVKGFLVPAMAAEVGKLQLSERIKMVKCVLEGSNGKIPVIGGTSSSNLQECQQIARRFIDMGCDGILVNLGFQNENQYRTDIDSIVKLDPNFLMIQDWDFNGYGLPISFIKKLFEEIEAFKALKIEVVPAGVKYSEVLDITDGKLHVSGGWAVMQMIEGLQRGVHAFMPTGMHEIYVKIYNLYHNGDVNGAQHLFNRLLPTLAFSNQHLDISIHFYKRLLYQQKVYSTPIVRQPILPFDPIHEIIASQHINNVINLISEIKTGKWN